MKNTTILIVLLALCFLVQTSAAEVVVSNVEAVQQDHPSKFFEITYDVESDAETVTITLELSADGGESWDVPVRTVEGDIGDGVEPGADKLIVWDGGSDYPDQINNQMRAKVTAEEDGGELQAGEERDFNLTDDVTITMCWIPAGEFEMGAYEDEQEAGNDEYPQHEVNIDYGFWMGKYEVTQAQWEAVMGSNPSYFDGANHPVEQVSWNDIQGFEADLDGAFRLPSESEWEYACRAGTETRFYWGDDPDYDEIGDYAWYSSNSNNQTHDVGQKRPNAWGLYDMSGNVYEWCEDWYHGNYNGAPDDGSAWNDNGSYRVFRGGDWAYLAQRCRSAYRNYYVPSYRCGSLGFRLLRSHD